jgi:hypothetical protein
VPPRMLGSPLPSFDLPLFLQVAGAIIVIAGSVVSGFRLHRLIDWYCPQASAFLPRDMGAWCGLACGCFLLWLGY